MNQILVDMWMEGHSSSLMLQETKMSTLGRLYTAISFLHDFLDSHLCCCQFFLLHKSYSYCPLPVYLKTSRCLRKSEIMSSTKQTEVHSYIARYCHVTLYTCYLGLTDFTFAQTVNWQLVFIYSLSPGMTLGVQVFRSWQHSGNADWVTCFYRNIF